ncbi:MAG: ATP-binding protein [Myxococcota bacterium]
MVGAETTTQRWWQIVETVCERIQSASAPDAEGAIHYALRELAKTIPADRGFIHLFEVEGRIAMSFESRHPDSGFTGARTDALTMDPVRPRLESGELVFVDLSKSPARSTVMSPLRVQGRCLGVLGFEGPSDSIHDVPKPVLTILTSSLTSVFLRMDHDRRSRQRSLEVATLDRLYEATEQCESVRSLASAGAKVARDSFACDGVAVLETSETKGLRVLFHSGLEPERLQRLQNLEEDRLRRLVERWHRFAVSTFAITDPSAVPTTASIDTGSEAWVSLHSVGSRPAWLILRQSSFSREWTVDERWLMAEVGRRLSEAMAHLRSRLEHLDREDRYREVLAAIPELVLVFDASSHLVEVCAQPSGLELIDPAAVGRGVRELFDPEAASLVHACAQRALSSDEVQTVELQHRFQARELTLSAQIRRFTSEKRPVILFVARDVTEQKELERRLVQSQRLESVGRLAGGLAHDFNNLLTAILGSVDLGRAEAERGGEVVEDLDQIGQAAQRGARLSRQLLAFAREDEVAPEIVTVDDLLISVDRMLRRLVGEHIEFVTVPGSPGTRVLVDPGQLEQVIINLVLNARDAMPEGGRLRVQTSSLLVQERNHHGLKSGEYVQIRVHDDGQGIPKEHIEKVFDPFFTTKQAGEGTGLGLSTAYGVVRRYGGLIEVERTSPQGSVFRVLLPSLTGPTESKAEFETTLDEMEGNETILLVEDEALVRRVSRRTLERLGYRVLEARNGPTALRMSSEYEGPIHLLITDIVMPQMSGTYLSGLLLESRPEMKALFISGYGEEAAVLTQRNPRMQFLPKPFGPSDLAQHVRKLLTTTR